MYEELHGEGTLTFTRQLYLNFESEQELIDYFIIYNGVYIRTFDIFEEVKQHNESYRFSPP
jgi:hypothetical protein